MSSPASRVVVRALSALAVVVSLFLVASPALADAKIAVIDMRRAVADTEDGLRVQAELQQLFDDRQNEFVEKEKGYNTAKEEFEKLQQNKNTPEAELRKRYADLEKRAFELQAAQVTFRRELQMKENELMTPIISTMMRLVRQLATKEGYDMVLNREAVAYIRSDLNITDRIVQMYNASSSTGPAPTPEKGQPEKKGDKAPATKGAPASTPKNKKAPAKRAKKRSKQPAKK